MSIFESQNFVKIARDIALSCWDWQRRQALQAAADQLQDAIKTFERSWSQQDLRTLNGAWAKCHLAIDAIKPGGGSDPVGGRLMAPKERKVA